LERRRDVERLSPFGAGPTVSVVVPAMNEADNLAHVLPAIPHWVHEVILVDDHCTDATVAVAQRLLPSVRVVENLAAPGKGNALQAGFAAATGDIIVALDADGSEDPGEIPLFVGALLAGADFAKGSRFIRGGGTDDMPLLRQLGNRFFVLLVRVLFGARFTDLCYGYNAFWRRVLPALALDAEGFEIETMLNIRAHKAGLAIKEVPSFEAERIHGVGRLLTFPDGWRVLQTIWRERSVQPAGAAR
jgi:glycosyltransferase involved in cell wall biosynthesis